MVGGTGAPLLVWRDARRDDRLALESFQCTEPKPSGPKGWRRRHSAEWELDVQSGIRREAGRIGKDRRCTLLLGLDAQGIAAVCHWCRLESDVYKILAIAVALRHRHKDGAHGREALSFAVGIIENEVMAAGLDGLEIHAWIDNRNWRSQALFQRFDFKKTCDLQHGLWQWTLSRDYY